MITFVAGYPCSGKTTFIKENFKNKVVIDVYDFQKDKKFLSVYDVLKSYEDAANALLTACQNNKDVIFEHTLLKSIRRKEYIYFLRKNGINDDIRIYFLIPNEEKHKRFLSERGILNQESFINTHQNVVEMPTIEEGFCDVIIIK